MNSNLGRKATEVARNINNLSPGTNANEQWFRKFHNRDESLKDEECSG